MMPGKATGICRIRVESWSAPFLLSASARYSSSRDVTTTMAGRSIPASTATPMRTPTRARPMRRSSPMGTFAPMALQATQTNQRRGARPVVAGISSAVAISAWTSRRAPNTAAPATTPARASFRVVAKANASTSPAPGVTAVSAGGPAIRARSVTAVSARISRSARPGPRGHRSSGRWCRRSGRFSRCANPVFALLRR